LSQRRHFKLTTYSIGGSASGTGAGTIRSNTISSFSPFTFSSAGKVIPNPLPVELLSFDAKPDGNVVNVKWATASEINSDYFMVQHSQDGIIFEDVEKVEAFGNSSTTKNYSAVDYEPYNDVSYYRLKQVDNDGKFAYSSIVSVKFQNANSLSVYPNPASGLFNISLSGQNGKEILLVVKDLLGREFYSRVVIVSNDKEVIAIDPSGKLAEGIYIVVATSDNNIYEKKIVIK